MVDEVMLAQLRRLREAFRDPLERTIYHYTSAEGFRGIVTSGEIWLTNAAFVNDTTECKLFWEVAAPLLRHKRLPNRHVQELLDKDRRPGNETYYIASFSQKENLLQQYRAYGSFCIGFDPRRMSSAGFNLYECVYTQQDIKKWVREKSKVPQWKECSDVVKGIAAYHLLFAAEMKYKSEHYSSEREVRVVSLANHTWHDAKSASIMYEEDPPIHFRDHPIYRLPVPYVKSFISPEQTRNDSSDPEYPRTETPLGMKRRKLKEEAATPRELLPITEVWIGPMARQEETKLAYQIMLGQQGYDVPVIASKIPYRGD